MSKTWIEKRASIYPNWPQRQNAVQLTMYTAEAEQILNLAEEAVGKFTDQLFNHDIVVFETVKVEQETAMISCHAHGFNGMKREEVVSKKETVLETEVKKFHIRKKRMWWTEVKKK